jgi:hypothetical protein
MAGPSPANPSATSTSSTRAVISAGIPTVSAASATRRGEASKASRPGSALAHNAAKAHVDSARSSSRPRRSSVHMPAPKFLIETTGIPRGPIKPASPPTAPRHHRPVRADFDAPVIGCQRKQNLTLVGHWPRGGGDRRWCGANFDVADGRSITAAVPSAPARRLLARRPSCG